MFANNAQVEVEWSLAINMRGVWGGMSSFHFSCTARAKNRMIHILKSILWQSQVENEGGIEIQTVITKRLRCQ